ncbi:UDP-glycosyltransferase 79B30-like [Neltuma alba]|uniref:UDP-glycosyltransferase 79B30-like n=1 Tax=Neltuma alba TaxID=207710 RepID=UPI0010A2C685|nr:UDP-glycosyltransferase 79B30-like [Prosopis alba]
MEVSLHIAMFPWFAMGHLTAYLQLSNKLAKKGHKISFFVPTRTQSKLQHLNLHPHLITFVPITIPPIEGLPHGAETTADVSDSLFPLIITAMDRIEKKIESLLIDLRPNFVFFDISAYWLPKLAQSLGIKTVQYWTVSAISIAYMESLKRQYHGTKFSAFDPMQTVIGLSDSTIKLSVYEARALGRVLESEFGTGVPFIDRMVNSGLPDAIGFRSCREMEGPFLDYLETLNGKSVLLSGYLTPEPPTSPLEHKWVHWLRRFKHGSVIYCALGSECLLQPNEFQDLLLGLELTGMPFLAALRQPIGFETVEEALPEEFKQRVEGRGMVYGGWVQQQLILEHPSVGCFITHCGSGSIAEALMNHCRLVLLPNRGDQFFNARLVSRSFKAGFEVERDEEDGSFTKESVCEAVKSVMDDESEVAREIRQNHSRLRNLLLSNDLESTYIESFCQKLQDLLK